MKLPDKIFGISTEEAYKQYLDRGKNQPESPKPEIRTSLGGIDEGDYIFMPSHKLYVAKERSYLEKNWYDAHKSLHQESARMLTLREFVDFLALLKNGNNEFKRIYNDITEVRDPYRAEWLDADFKVVNNQLHINYNPRIINGELKPKNSEPLEACLMKDCKVDLMSFNKQGLPIKEGIDFNYLYPRSDNNSVARFGADSGGAGLGCGGDPRGSDSELGVRAARDKV